MVSVCIKYFFILLGSSYLFRKLLYIPLSAKQKAVHLLIPLVLSIFHAFAQRYTPSLSLLFVISLFCMAELFLFRRPWRVTVVTAILSFGFSYVAFLLTMLALSPFGFLFRRFIIKEEYLQTLFSAVIVGSLQMLCCTIPFFSRRLKKGMPFLYKQGSSDLGVFISISLVITASFFYVLEDNNFYFIIPIFYIIIAGLILFFWWKGRLTKSYLEKLKSNELSSLKNEVEKLEQEIASLKQNNDALSKIIHKDNKLIPAMQLAVQELFLLVKSGTASSDLQEKAQALSAQLNRLAEERQGILTVYEKGRHTLPSTGVSRIDAILQYMARKAMEEGNQFDVILHGSVKYMVEHIISEEDLSTLLADLLENARIANRGQPQKYILLLIGIEDDHYRIDVLDSGVPFAAEPLVHFGKARYTTYAKEGGSGIGLMTIHEIIMKNAASFVLDDTAETVKDGPFVKKISISFDGKRECCIRSDREDFLKKFAFYTDKFRLLR